MTVVPWHLDPASAGRTAWPSAPRRPGSGSAILNPQTGRPSDDLLATIDSFSS